MELDIYRKDGTVKLTVSPDTSSTISEEVMGENVVSVGFTHYSYIVLHVNDYITIDHIKYKIKSEYRPKQKNKQKYEYNVKFYAPIHDAENILMLFTDNNDITTEFSYDGDPRAHVQLWVDNMNRVAGENIWRIGTVISGENKSIDYRNVFCWDAAFGSNGIAVAYDTEMWADGNYINLCKAERGERIELGYLNGLTELYQEENGEIGFFTRLYPLGSTRNINASKYGSSRLQLPDGSKYVDKNADQYGIIEHYEETAFAEIFPQYTGTVSSVRTEKKTNEDGREYTIYYIKDDGLEFNPTDYEIPGLNKKISFQTGELAGRGTDGSFDVNWLEESSEWEIINIYPDDSTQLPGGVIIPNIGDRYIPWNISLPDEYTRTAEQAFLAAVDNYLEENTFDPNKYNGNTDRNYIEKNGLSITIGQNVRLLSDEYFSEQNGYKDTRITKVVRKLNDLFEATITCADKIGESWKASVDNSLSDLQYQITQSVEQTIIDIIKTGESKTPSDNNVFSALVSLAKFHRKDKADSNPFLQKFLKGIEIGDFVSGLLGTGGAIRVDENGNSLAEFDYLTIRKVATFIELLIQEMKYVGGAFIVSPAGAKISKVEETDDAYRCFFEQKDGDRTINNQFTVGTLARRQTYNLTEQAYYWRLVTNVGENWIDLSKTNCDSNSTTPLPGDEIVGLGHLTDKKRQGAIIISAFGDDAPSIKYYQGIDSFSLVGKEINADYYDPTTGRFKSVTYGDKYIGAPDRTSFFEYIDGKGLKVKGAVEILPGSVGASNFQDLPEEIYKAVKIGSENLLKNTSFAGDYESLTLTSQTKLNSKTDLYSPRLNNWTGSATVVEDSNAVSGYSVALGSISQNINLIQGEIYVVSYKAKGNSIQIECGTNTIKQQLTSEYKRYSHVFTNNNATSFTVSGSASLCDLKLERGTIATDWCPSVQDPDQVKDGFKHLWYLQEALQGSTKMIGGLTLTSMIQLGKWTDGILEKITAGVSGIYNNDNDVAFWSGGTFESAIKVVNMIINGETPSDEEWKSLAKFIATHGGDIIIRGYIYALGGVFRGTVFAENGEFNGKITTAKNGQRIEIDPETQSLVMYNENDNKCLELTWQEGVGGLNVSSLNLKEYDNTGSIVFQTVLSGRLITMYDKSSGSNILMQPDQFRMSKGNMYTSINNNTISIKDGDSTRVLLASAEVLGDDITKTEDVLLSTDENGFDTYMRFVSGLFMGTYIK